MGTGTSSFQISRFCEGPDCFLIFVSCCFLSLRDSHRECGASLWKWWWSAVTWSLWSREESYWAPSQPWGTLPLEACCGELPALWSTCSRRILILLLWSCKVGWIWSCKGSISLACCYTRFALEKLYHLLFDFNHLSLELASKEAVRKKCICEVSTCKTWQVSEVWHCRWGMSESERRLCC